MIFRDRLDAARHVASALEDYRSEHPLILGIPRGGVPLAKYVAGRLGTDMDLVMVRKIGAPGNPEFAIGSVTEFGDIYASEAVEAYGIPESYIRETADRELDKIASRRKTFGSLKEPVDPSGRTVIIIDDGIATGSTMISAIRSVRARNAKKVVVATPVASRQAIRSLRGEADEVVCVHEPEAFFGVSGFYEDFHQLSDADVARMLRAGLHGGEEFDGSAESA